MSIPVLRVLLVGFMASGKSTVGREVARRLGWAFLDFDTEVERRRGASISDIFAAEGEAGRSGRETTTPPTPRGLRLNADAITALGGACGLAVLAWVLDAKMRV